SETDEINRRQKIEEFRKEYFTPEQIDRLRKVDAEVAAEEEHLKRYRAEENKILQTTGMSQNQQDGAIKALQDQYFGTEK
ncbi:MAG TPA: lipase secretion chaperone, partial [Smithellaceae bacterium]|nr:lipase secretion chaperone [Smithellaceae bacterium]